MIDTPVNGETDANTPLDRTLRSDCLRNDGGGARDGAELSEPADQLRRAVCAGWADRRAGAGARSDHAGEARRLDRGGEQDRRVGCGRCNARVARRAGWVHPPGQCARRCAEPPLHQGAVQRDRRFHDDRKDHRWPAAGADRQGRPAVQDAEGADRGRQEQPEQDLLRHFGARDLAGDFNDAAQSCRRHQDRRRAVSRLGRGGCRGGDGRGAGDLHVLHRREAADRRRQGAPARGRGLEAHRGHGPMCRRWKNSATRTSTTAALSGLSGPPSCRNRSWRRCSKALNEFDPYRSLQDPHGGARHDHSGGGGQHAGESRGLHAD